MEKGDRRGGGRAGEGVGNDAEKGGGVAALVAAPRPPGPAALAVAVAATAALTAALPAPPAPVAGRDGPAGRGTAGRSCEAGVGVGAPLPLPSGRPSIPARPSRTVTADATNKITAAGSSSLSPASPLGDRPQHHRTRRAARRPARTR